MSGPIDVRDAGLPERIGSPPRRRRAEAEEVVRGLRDPAAAWRALATGGLIPEHWVDDSRRVFGDWDWCPCTDRVVPIDCPACTGGFITRFGPHPESVAEAALFGSDGEGVAAAEAFAAAAGARMAAWQESSWAAANGVLWRVCSARWDNLVAAQNALFGPPTRPGRAAEAAATAEERVGAAAAADMVGGGGRFDVRPLMYHAALWRRVAARGACVPGAGGVRFDALESPFEPLLGLLATGYLFEGEFDGRLVLRMVAPEPAA